MEYQARTQDFKRRVPENQFTEVGQIGCRYNQVMQALEDSLNQTEAIIENATKPAKEPLIINSTSGRRYNSQPKTAPTNIPDVPAKMVLTITVATRISKCK